MPDRLNFRDGSMVIWLATGLLLTVAWAIQEAGWTQGLNVLIFVTLGSIIISLMIIRSRLPGLIAHLFGLIIGLGWSFWVTSRLLPSSYTWLMRWENLVLRLERWYLLAMQGGTSYDNLMFIFQMAVITWVVGYLTIWLMFHSGRVWPAIIPGGLVLLVNYYYAPRDLTFWLLLYILLALLLIIRFNLFEYQRLWRAEKVYFRPDISFDFLRDGVIFSVLLLGIAWYLPSLVTPPSAELFERFEGEWRDVQDQWNRLFANLNYRPTTTVDTFGQSLTLGGPRNLTNEPVMDVRAERGRYWRAVVFDEYTGQSWRSKDESTIEIGPSTLSALPPSFDQRRPITQTFTIFRDGGLVLYALSNPVWTSLDARAYTTFVDKERVAPQDRNQWIRLTRDWTQDLTYLKSRSSIDAGEPYQVVSDVSMATVEQLQTAGANYPEWVRARYLQLPDGIPQRVFDLAQEITAGADNPFDQAGAIETYLRTNIEYNEGIQAPPPDRDKVDYILFDLKQAYCDYYATSMIVLLRSLGVPARMAAGFAGGEYDLQANAYHVLNRNAHSWVEVYFPRYGWIEFEPTAAQPLPARLREAADSGPASGGVSPNEGDFDPLDRLEDVDAAGSVDELNLPFPAFSFNLPLLGSVQVPRAAVNWGGAGLVLALVAGGLWFWRRHWLAAPGTPVGQIYGGMLWFARRIGLKLLPSHTPYEQAGRLTVAVPEGKDEIDFITHEYVRHRFSRHTPDSSGQQQTIRAWQRLRPKLLRSIFQHRLTQLVERFRL